MKKYTLIPLFLTIMLAYTLPLTTANNTNYAPIPTQWTTSVTGFHFGIGGVANLVADSSVTYQNYISLRIGPTGTTDNEDREANSMPREIHPGDHIHFSAWIKTSAAAEGETDRGARIGLDFYDDHRITGVQTPNGAAWTQAGGYPFNEDGNFVDWGSEWTHIVMDFTVPAYYEADPYASEYTEGEHVEPSGIIPWLQVCSDVDGGQAWFANAELYINPTQASTVTPVPITVPVIHSDYSFVAILVTLAAFAGLGIFLYKALFGER